MKLAVPTDDGVTISTRFVKAKNFALVEVDAGAIVSVKRRRNPAARKTSRGRGRLVLGLVKDCRTVIAFDIPNRLRAMLARRGIDVVITSERLLYRATALFALAALADETRRWDLNSPLEPDPLDQKGLDDFDA